MRDPVSPYSTQLLVKITVTEDAMMIIAWLASRSNVVVDAAIGRRDNLSIMPLDNIQLSDHLHAKKCWTNDRDFAHVSML